MRIYSIDFGSLILGKLEVLSAVSLSFSVVGRLDQEFTAAHLSGLTAGTLHLFPLLIPTTSRCFAFFLLWASPGEF